MLNSGQNVSSMAHRSGTVLEPRLDNNHWQGLCKRKHDEDPQAKAESTPPTPIMIPPPFPKKFFGKKEWKRSHNSLRFSAKTW